MNEAQTTEDLVLEGCKFSFHKRMRADGSRRFTAETVLRNGEKVLVDHWNRSILEKQIEMIVPVMLEARQSSKV